MAASGDMLRRLAAEPGATVTPLGAPLKGRQISGLHLQIFWGCLDGLLEEEVEAARRQARRGQWRHKALPLGCRGRHAASRLRRVEIRTSMAHLSKLTMPRDTPRT